MMTAPPERARRKSTGGKAPRRIPPGPHYHNFEDHAGRTYAVARGGPGPIATLAKLGIQLYCLGTPHPSPEALGNSFLNCDAMIGAGNARGRWPRVDVYSDFSNIDECIEHHRREKVFRKQAVQDMKQKAVAGLSEEDAHEKLINEVRGKEPLPHIVPTWCESEKFWSQYRSSDRYRSWIFVMPEGCQSWEDIIEKGIYKVDFDLDVNPATETEMYDGDLDEDTLLEGEKHGWVEVEKTGVEKSEPVQHRLLCVRNSPRDTLLGFKDSSDIASIEESTWRTPGYEGDLFNSWVRATQVFWDCTYRLPCCDGCDEDEPHDACEIELNEHYFDEDGQCVACRRKTEYRRRSKRIVERGEKGGVEA
ncbi:hypothetical protein EDB81DRAFT_784935 [Dactylonectria macrodidyma]|uniref:Uncharacterized protein n=1 Tax=Dactylonectria macrodidyma TaxID=307937 RepID=A0A9P9FGN5_9HYPO|nr:hypothetical protein EDB81DRAFT_784935 [Dactylonectria macrodidyma]